jgi:hypothetical protein
VNYTERLLGKQASLYQPISAQERVSATAKQGTLRAFYKGFCIGIEKAFALA